MNNQLATARNEIITPNFIKTAIFLFQENRSTNHIGNYFDGQDPYRQNWIDFYSIQEGKRIHHEKQIFMNTETSFGFPPAVREKIEEFYNNFRMQNAGHTIIVLPIGCDDSIPIRKRVDDAIRRYAQTKKVYKILPAV